MFDIAPSEFLLVAFVALVVIGPKDLPKAMRVVGYWVGKARGVARQFRSGFDSMVREAELEEMEKRWASENERIMREHPQSPTDATADDAQVVHSPETEEHRRDYRSIDNADDHTNEPVMVEKPVVAPAASVDGGLDEAHGNRPVVAAPLPDRAPDLFDTQSATPNPALKPVDDKTGKSDVAPS
ncbi:Sec-independent protein translocase protein TatB [Sphingomonas sp. PB2P12]|uniref:Sec-independent protein translocase protein TatB n=1 Tax=Sphingomonas sandaracina TaxID=3096157 RepID=UPI002FCA16E9